MFLRLKTYTALVVEAAVATALATAFRGEAQKREAEAMNARREVKRLTDVIIHLKDEGHTLPAGHGDGPWPEGKYLQQEYEPVEEAPSITGNDEEVAIADAQLQQELEAALKDH